MRIKHQSVKIQYSSSSQLTLYSSILILSVCVGATRGMLLMDDLFGEIAFGTSLNLSNNQSSKQLIEAKKYNVPGITRILQAGSLLLLLCPVWIILQLLLLLKDGVLGPSVDINISQYKQYKIKKTTSVCRLCGRIRSRCHNSILDLFVSQRRCRSSKPKDTCAQKSSFKYRRRQRTEDWMAFLSKSFAS